MIGWCAGGKKQCDQGGGQGKEGRHWVKATVRLGTHTRVLFAPPLSLPSVLTCTAPLLFVSMALTPEAAVMPLMVLPPCDELIDGWIDGWMVEGLQQERGGGKRGANVN